MLRISYLRKTKLVKADTAGIMDNMQDTTEDKIGVTTVNIVNTVTPRGALLPCLQPQLYGLELLYIIWTKYKVLVHLSLSKCSLYGDGCKRKHTSLQFQPLFKMF
jgi:hypothetical protein